VELSAGTELLSRDELARRAERCFRRLSYHART
jgi:hypothetical protein